MFMENIICPNCGAQNHHYGTCEYCGTTIREPKTTTTTKQNDAESFAQKIAKYQEVEPFIGGVAVVSIGKQRGAINEQGDIVVPLSSSYVYNYDGRLLICGEECKVTDAHGKILAEANRIDYIGNGEYLLRSAEDGEKILNQKNEHLAVKLPKGIRIYALGALGYGCYRVSDGRNQGIALRDRLLLPCHYCIYHQEWGRFYTENKHLIVAEDCNISKYKQNGCCYGIFDLNKKQFALPCHYYFGNIGSSIDDYYKSKLVKVMNSKGNYGVFDVDSQDFVIHPEYKQVIILDNRACEVTKKGLFGSKTTTIQL